MKRNEILELTIQSYAYEGLGVAKIPVEKDGVTKDFVIFVQHAYPGDTVKAEIRKIKKSYAEAKLVEVISPSAERIKARCNFFGTCGGCKQQDLFYPAQARYKQEQVKDIFNGLGGFTDFALEEIISAEQTFYYRNKMEFSFAEQRWLTLEEINSNEEIDRNFALGLHIPNIFDKVLDLDECFLQSETSNKILNFTRKFFKDKNTSIYTTKTHTGYLRNLVIKESKHFPELMVNLVTLEENDELMDEYTHSLKKEISAVTTIINNISTKKALVAIGEYEKVFYGNGIIHDTIGEYKFRISANSFFQTNTLQAVNLYQTALDYAGLSGNEVVYDLYCGAGTISTFVSKFAKEVYGFEVVQSAINDAEVNKKLNHTENVKFFLADLYDSFLNVIESQNIPQPDVIIADPPRNGMHKNTVADIIKLSPKKIVYVSCNPTTQVRDLKLLCEAGYKLVKAKPVDMFPQTYHIENVALLEKIHDKV
ncbi:MAG: 23S rRNA (uracil(1939)-C(5))-methyltransferase RlmD [Ignavibacteriaceae bacterium]|jgi:23S rRNA (uracil1939-C5)-methyltransferase